MERFRGSRSAPARQVCARLRGGTATGCARGLGTARQLGHWRSSKELLEHTLKVTRNNHIIHNNLGAILLDEGDLSGAVTHFRAALTALPHYAEARHNLGLALFKQSRNDQAIAEFRTAIELNPKYADAHNSLGLALAKKGEAALAIEEYRAALRLRPSFVNAHHNLANMLMKSRSSEAIEHYTAALQFEPSRVETLNNLARLYATHEDSAIRNGPEAILLAERADKLTAHENHTVLDTLAAAYAETGRFREAAETARLAQRRAQSVGQDHFALAIGARLILYEAGKPFRMRYGQ